MPPDDTLQLSIGDFYRELAQNPDLRRLGKYTVIAKEGSDIIPVDLNLEGRDIYLGEGDFRGAFTAFANTKARSVDFGNSVFTDLYLDYLVVENLHLSNARASRFYFDFAKVEHCNFGNFTAPEVYFDEAHIGSVFKEHLRTGILYLGKLKAKNFEVDGIRSNAFRITSDLGQAHPLQDRIDSEATRSPDGDLESAHEEVLELYPNDLVKELQENPDLRRLGKYRVLPGADSASLSISVDLSDADINLGDGDYSLLHTSFGQSISRSIDFGTCLFTKLQLGSLRAQRLDFAHSQVPFLNFEDASVGECFFGDFQGYVVHFDDAKVGSVFGERSLVQDVYLDHLSAEQFNINSLRTESFMMGRSRVREMYLSVGTGVTIMRFEESELELLNLHEGKLKEVDFGNSRITRAMINKATVDVVRCENLVAEVLFVGNYKNRIGLLEFGDNKGIKHIELEKALPSESGQEVKRSAFGKFSFGKLK